MQGVGPKTEGAVGYVYPGSGDTKDNRPPLRRATVEAAAGAPAASAPSGAADSTTAAAVAGVAAAVASELMATEAGSINAPEGEESRQQQAAAQEVEDEVSAAACSVCWDLAGACSRQQLLSRFRNRWVQVCTSIVLARPLHQGRCLWSASTTSMTWGLQRQIARGAMQQHEMPSTCTPDSNGRAGHASPLLA